MIFCKHEWKLLSTETTISKYECAIKAFDLRNLSSLRLAHQLCDAERKHIQVFSCDKCGNLKRFVESI